MAIRQQRLHSIDFDNLKGLKKITIDVEPHLITGIFGANGSGKSSVIHALLSIYKPSDEDLTRPDYKLSRFFRPTSHTEWHGSKFTIEHSFRQDRQIHSSIKRIYRKQADRWAPRHTNRPERNVYFVGLSTSVPDIELEKRDNRITLLTAPLNDQVSTEILNRAAAILNRNYDQYNIHNGGGKTYIGLRYNNLQYSSLSMGAGEQRILKILEVVFRAPRYSLIVIDELDATLHTDALNRLIDVLVAKASVNQLQIVFTSHREELIKRTDINIRHIYQTNVRTLCFNDTNPDCLARLTGTRVRPIELFVEDSLSEAIATRVAEELNIVRFCSIKKFGAAGNAFSLVTGMTIKGEDLTNVSVFLDGDVYKTDDQKLEQMEKFFTGTEVAADAKRRAAIAHIRMFDLPEGNGPEMAINAALQRLNDGSEVCNAAIQINGVLDKHDFVDKIIESLGYSEEQGLSKVVAKLANSDIWQQYSAPLRDWLLLRANALNLLHQ